MLDTRCLVADVDAAGVESPAPNGVARGTFGLRMIEDGQCLNDRQHSTQMVCVLGMLVDKFLCAVYLTAFDEIV